MTGRQLAVAAGVGALGVLLGAVAVGLWAPAADAPPGVPAAASSAAASSAAASSAAASSAAASSAATPPAASAGGLPPAPDAPVASPEEVARWQAEEPVALHAARDAERWLDVADHLRQLGQGDLEIRARTCSARLQRALEPQTDDEVRDALVTEVELLRDLSFLARDELHDDDFLALLRDIEMGAHHALQGAPPPEDFDQPVVPETAAP